MYTKYETITNNGYSLVDNYTGEIKEFKQTRKINYDEFLLVFLSTIPEMYQLNGGQLKVLIACWRHSTFNPSNSEEGNILHNNPIFKKKLREEGIDMSNSAIDVYIHQLTKQGFLIKQCKGCYILNPKYFFKGRVADAAKMRLTFETM